MTILKSNYIICFLLIFLASCNFGKSDRTRADQEPLDNDSLVNNEIQRNLENIKKEGKLKALIAYSGTSYFLYRGHPMGYDYELLSRFAEHLNVELELHVSKNINHLISELKKGNADIVAHGLAITNERKKHVAFTDYLFLTQQVLVQRKPDDWRRMTLDNIKKSIVQDPIELIDDTVSVRANSSYYYRLKNLSEEMGGTIIIDTMSGKISTEELIKMVADGEIKYTIADKHLANIYQTYYRNLDVDVPVSFSQRIAWAVNPKNTKLLEEANNWIKAERNEADYFVIYNKYFTNKLSFRSRIKSDFYSINKNQISEYDHLIKENAKIVGWDWRLFASLIYQESQFNPRAQSWAGAKGLIQIMPATAEEMGVIDPFNPDENIKGGTLYLKKLYDRFDAITDPLQRIKFTMAAFNCGYSHVKDAQTLAEINKLDKHRWDSNVDIMILSLSYPQNYNRDEVKFGYVKGVEPYEYVQMIFERFEHYQKFIQ
jgi:membrane-bound lytic murein transglycosylase F